MVDDGPTLSKIISMKTPGFYQFKKIGQRKSF
jgi:hypothetical protein